MVIFLPLTARFISCIYILYTCCIELKDLIRLCSLNIDRRELIPNLIKTNSSEESMSVCHTLKSEFNQSYFGRTDTLTHCRTHDGGIIYDSWLRSITGDGRNEEIDPSRPPPPPPPAPSHPPPTECPHDRDYYFITLIKVMHAFSARSKRAGK